MCLALKLTYLYNRRDTLSADEFRGGKIGRNNSVKTSRIFPYNIFCYDIQIEHAKNNVG